MNTPKDNAGKPPVRLGDLLLEKGLITQDQLRIALLEQKAMGKPLGEALLALGFVTEEALRGALATNLGEVAISLGGIVADPAALKMIPKAMAKRHTLFPVGYDPVGSRAAHRQRGSGRHCCGRPDQRLACRQAQGGLASCQQHRNPQRDRAVLWP
jgi:hypothetical protein